jgi:hypothetical protein
MEAAHLPKNDNEYEKSLLCCLIQQPALLSQSSIYPELLQNPSNQKILSALRAAHAHGRVLEFLTVEHYCRAAHLHKDFDDTQSMVRYLDEVFQKGIVARNWEWYRDGLENILVRRKAFESASSLQSFVADADPARLVTAGEVALRLEEMRLGLEHLAAHQTRTLSTHSSVVALADEPIDWSQNLLGNRWLSRGTGAIICAPSGIGKSTLSIQAAILWSAGKAAFYIKPLRPWRILILQSEDDRNDMREMCQVLPEMLKAGFVTHSDLALIDKNTHIERVNDLAGEPFVRQLDRWLAQSHFDIVITNPLMSFVGGELSEQTTLTNFLRIQLGPVLERHSAGAIVIHHTGKLLGEKGKEKREWWEYMYLLFGSSELTNWARAILFIKPTADSGVFEFISAKRFEKIGWTDRSYFFCHSKNSTLWLSANAEQIAAITPANCKLKNIKPNELLALIPKVDPISQDELFESAKTMLAIGEKKTRRFANILLDQEKIYIHHIPRLKVKSAVGYAQSKPT